MHKLLTLLLTLLVTFSVSAQTEVSQDGVKYTLFTPENAVPYAVVTGNSLTTATNLVLPPVITHEGVNYPVTAIADYALYKLPTLLSVIIPKSVVSIGSGAFYGDSAMTTVEIPASVKSIGKEAFALCEGLLEIYYPTDKPIASEQNIFSTATYALAELIVAEGGLANAKVTLPWSFFATVREKDFSMGTIFRQGGLVYSLYGSDQGNLHATVASNTLAQPTNLTIPSSVTNEGLTYEVTKIGRGAFMSSRSLAEVTIPESVTEIESWAFADCAILSTVNLPASLSTLGTGVFANCNILDNVVIPESVTSIGTGTFGACISLSKITFPSSLRTIGRGSFGGCVALADLVIPEGVTSIGGMAFSACTSLTTIELPGSLKGIGRGAFTGCTAIAEINYLTKTPITASTEIFSPQTYAKATLLVDGGGLDNAKDTEPWKQFQTIKESKPAEPVEITENNLTYTLYNPGASNRYAAVTGNSITEAELLIPATVTYEGMEYQVTTIGSSAFASCYSLKSVVIPEGVGVIGDRAFYNCIYLQSLKLPSSLKEIGSNAFGVSAMTSLSEIFYASATPVAANENVFPNNVYSHAILFVADGALENMEQTLPWSRFNFVSGIDFSNTSTAVVDGMRLLIVNDANPHAVVAGNTLDTATELMIPETVAVDGAEFKVTEIGQAAFRSSQYLTAVTVPATVTRIGRNAFDSCGKLTAVRIADSVTEIGEAAFHGCNALAEIALPENLAVIENDLMYGCSALKSVVLPPNITSIGDAAFGECQALAEIDIPASVRSIGSRAFIRCYQFKSVVIPEGVAAIGDMAFYNCIYLQSLRLPSSLKEIGSNAFGVSAMTSLSEVFYASATPVAANENLFPSSVYSQAILFVPDGALENMEQTLPWSRFNFVSGIDFSNTSTAVVDGMRLLIVNDANPHAVVAGNTLDTATDLMIPETVAVDGAEFKVTEIGQAAFRSSQYLTAVTVPATVTRIGRNAFDSCGKLTAVRIADSVTEIGEAAFHGCNALAEIALPENLAVIENDLMYGCSALKSVVLPPNITSIGDAAFAECQALAEIDIPASVRSIGSRAFIRCYQFKSVVIPEGVAAIGDMAFYSCIYLQSLKLPSSLKEIGSNAFGVSAMTSLSEVFYASATPVEANENVFPSNTYSSATLYVDLGGLEVARKTLPWSRFSNIVEIDFGSGSKVTLDGIRYTLYVPGEGVPYAVISGNELSETCDLVIPSSIEAEGQEYIISTIGISAFEGCAALASVELPASVKTIARKAFYGCESLNSVILPDTLASIGESAFGNCSKLSYVYYMSDKPINGESNVFGSTTYQSAVLYIKAGQLKTVQALSPWKDFKTIRELSESVTIPLIHVNEDNIVYTLYSETTGEKYAVVSGNTLSGYSENVAIRSAITVDDTEYPVTTIGEGAFQSSSNLSTVTIPNSVTKIKPTAFWNCTQLKSVTLPTAIVELGESSFGYCQALNEIKYLTTEPIAAPVNVFMYDYSNAERLYETATLYVAEGGLENALAVTPWNLFKTIRDEAGNKPEIIPVTAVIDNVKYTLYPTRETEPYATVSGNEISDDTGLVIPSSVEYEGKTYLVNRIASGAFMNCNGLTAVTIPSSVNAIGNQAFAGCERLLEVNYLTRQPVAADENVFDEDTYEKAMLCVADKGLDAAMTTVPWSLFQNLRDESGNLPLSKPVNTVIDNVEYTLYMPNLNNLYAEVTGNTISETVRLSIPDSVVFEGKTYGVTAIADAAFKGCADITGVTIPAGIGSIGSEAFAGCDNILEVTYLTTRPVSADSNVFSETTYGEAMLCVAEGGLDAAQATVPWSLFMNMRDEAGNVPPAKPVDAVIDNVKYVLFVSGDRLLAEVKGLATDATTELVLPDNVAYDGKDYTVVSIGSQAFKNCTQLTSVTLPTVIDNVGGEAFYGCDNILEVTYLAMPPYKFSWDMFSSLTYDKATLCVAEGALEAALNTMPWQLFKSIRDEAGNVPAVEPTVVTVDNVEYTLREPKESEAYAEVTGNDISSETNLTLPASIEHSGISYPVRTIGSNAFAGCAGLNAVVLPESVDTISARSFAGCEALTFVDIPGTVKEIRNGAFAECDALLEVYYRTTEPVAAPANTFSAEAYENATLYVEIGGIGNALGCEPWKLFANIEEKDFTLGSIMRKDGLIYSLVNSDNGSRHASVISNYLTEATEVIIPESITHEGMAYPVTAIGRGAFKSSKYVVTAEVPESVTEIDSWAFADCAALTKITLPAISAVNMGTFANCRSLTSISLPASVSVIGSGAFTACLSLRSVDMPGVTVIEKGAFTGCVLLTDVKLPDGLTAIGGAAFSGCASLVSLQIPETIQAIGQGAFFGCTGLKEIYYLTMTPVSGTADMFSPETYTAATLYVEPGSADTFKTTTPWNLFRNISNSLSSVDDVLNGYDLTAPIEVYNLNGIKVADSSDGINIAESIRQLAKGYYIIRQGDKTSKVVVR